MGSIMRTEFLCISVKNSIWTASELLDCKSALKPASIYTTDCSKAVVPVLLSV